MGGVHICAEPPQRCIGVWNAIVFGKDMERRTLIEEEEDVLALLGAGANEAASPLGDAAAPKGERK